MIQQVSRRTLRERLVAQLVDINSADEAAAWAHRNLPAKNTLTAGDAQIVEERFRARLSTVSDDLTPDGSPTAGPDQTGVPAGRPSQQTAPVAKKRSRS